MYLCKVCIGIVSVLSLVKCSKMSDKECCEESWMYGLKKEGLYYEGVVAHMDNLLENYKRETVMTWGTRRSSTNMNGGEYGDLSDCVNTVSFVGLAIIVFQRFRIQDTVFTNGIANNYPYSQHFKAKSKNRKPTSAWHLFSLLT